MNCETCRYWSAVLSEAARDQARENDTPDADAGWCRRYPPTFTGGYDPLFGPTCWNFPVTEFDSWCGEYGAGDPVEKLGCA